MLIHRTAGVLCRDVAKFVCACQLVSTNMRLPSPAYREYVELVATVLVTITVLQYIGIFGPSKDVDITYLVIFGLTLPLFTYLLTVAGENIAWVSEWDRMVQNEE